MPEFCKNLALPKHFDLTVWLTEVQLSISLNFYCIISQIFLFIMNFVVHAEFHNFVVQRIVYCNKIFMMILCFFISSPTPTSRNKILHCNVDYK